jgi:hypothetical protein
MLWVTEVNVTRKLGSHARQLFEYLGVGRRSAPRAVLISEVPLPKLPSIATTQTCSSFTLVEGIFSRRCRAFIHCVACGEHLVQLSDKHATRGDTSGILRGTPKDVLQRAFLAVAVIALWLGSERIGEGDAVAGEANKRLGYRTKLGVPKLGGISEALLASPTH